MWGTVTRWEPPTAVAFTWHPGQPAERASHVEVTFAAADGQTLVTLEHAGWEVFADPAAARAEYDQGWPVVLDRYRVRRRLAADAGRLTAAAGGQAARRGHVGGAAAPAGSGRARRPGRCSRIRGSPITSRS